MIPRILLLIMILASLSSASRFFIDPRIGSMISDGSVEHPWSTLKEVFEGNKIASRIYATKPVEAQTVLIPKNQDAPVKPGDTLVLRSGYHGAILAREYYNEKPVLIIAFPGDTPTISNLELRSCSGWIVRGLTISPSFGANYGRNTLITLSSDENTGPTRNCSIEECFAYSVYDASKWTQEQWNTLSCDGISLEGNNLAARNNHFKNVNWGILVTGDSCLVEKNTVENFAGDGINGLGNYCTYQYNIVKNLYLVNDNHPDGFQSWSMGAGGVGTGVVYGVIFRGNTIINYEDPAQPFRGTLQGMGCFDGFFEGWRIENNVIRTDHWHGITLTGATKCVIINNTVVDLNTTEPGPPWIRISNHKNGSLSTGCVIRNNLTTDFNVSSEGVIQDHNIVIENYDDYFVNYRNGDLHLKSGCSAIDAGSGELSPLVDRDGNVRPQVGGVDIGAYEYGSTGVVKSKTMHRQLKFLSYSQSGRTVVFTSREPIHGEVVLFDLRGNKLQTINGSDRCRLLWKTNNLSSGSYIIRCVYGEKYIYQKIFLKNG